MKKLILSALACALCLTACERGGIAKFDEIGALVTEKGYTKEQLLEELSGQDREDIIDAWGEPNGCLSGLWGDIWCIDEEHLIVLYYDGDGKVMDVVAGKPEIPSIERS